MYAGKVEDDVVWIPHAIQIGHTFVHTGRYEYDSQVISAFWQADL